MHFLNFLVWNSENCNFVLKIQKSLGGILSESFGTADVDYSRSLDFCGLKMHKRWRIVWDKHMWRWYGLNDESLKKALHPYIIGNWVTIKLPHAPKGASTRSRPLQVKKIISQWRYLFSDGQVWNATWMSHFFPAEQGEGFLVDWYSPDTFEMPIPWGGGEIEPAMLARQQPANLDQ